MKKILLIVSLLLCVFIVCACTHEHTEGEGYKSDDNYHWIPCDDAECDATFEKVEHSWGEGEITTKPTSAQDGVMSYLCTVCKRLKQEPVKYNPSTTVNSTQWYEAFDLTRFENVSASLVEIALRKATLLASLFTFFEKSLGFGAKATPPPLH